MHEIVNRIIFLLEHNNMTAKELTEHLGLNKSTISEWKGGKTKPSIDASVGISQIFGVSLDWLLTGEGEMTKQLQSPEAESVQLSVEEKLLLENYRDMPERYKLELQKIAARMAVDSEQPPSSNSTTTDGEEAATIENRVG